MSGLTIHGIDPALDRRLADEARRRRTSKNRLVKELLATALGLPVEGEHRDDYAEFCGLWSAEERVAFDARLRDVSTVEPADWTG